MSWQPAAEPESRPKPCDGVAGVIEPKGRDIGGFEVRRVLPAAERRAVGPFVFLDQMGPAELPPGRGIDVRPHPHIGLATVTYLFDGEILHRDSLGSSQPIRPGELNWMTAGRGIVHSERTPPAVRASGHRLFGMQAWVALPRSHEESEPAFVHHGAEALPLVERPGARIRVIAGRLFGVTAPVELLSELFYADASLEEGATLEIAPEHEERGLYLVEGELAVGERRFTAGRLLLLEAGVTVTCRAETAVRAILLGGAPLGAPRRLWWNFVSSSKERIEQAKADWKAGRFPRVPDDPEAIPLPE